MIDEIFEMIMKEARTRKGGNLRINAIMVIFELTDKVCQTLRDIEGDDIKSIRLKFRRRQE